MDRWNMEKLEELNRIEKEIDELITSRDQLRVQMDFWAHNPLSLVRDYEGVYELADIILQMDVEPVYPEVRPALRDLLVSVIAIPFDYFELFAYPARARYAFERNQTHVTYLRRITEMWLDAYDCMVDKSLGCGLSYTKGRGWWVNAEKVPRPQWLSVVQYRASRKHGEDTREEAWEHLGELIKQVCKDDGVKLYEKTRQYQADRGILIP